MTGKAFLTIFWRVGGFQVIQYHMSKDSKKNQPGREYLAVIMSYASRPSMQVKNGVRKTPAYKDVEMDL